MTSKYRSQSSTNKDSKNYAVIDTIRFLAMCSVVWGHCNMGLESTSYHSMLSIAVQSVILQTGKIGTIIFFVISGFLLETKIERHTIKSFISSRFRSTIIPWFNYTLIFSTFSLYSSNLFLSAIDKGNGWQMCIAFVNEFKTAVFYFAYWFIIVFLISSLILIASKKYLHKMALGLILVTFTLYYSINLHFHWTSVHHTQAFLGYVFFMWLGIQISANYRRFSTMINKWSWGNIGALLALSMILACAEGVMLSNSDCADPFASIRFSNIITSLWVFVALFKMGGIEKINKLNPRKNVFNIYLVHNIFILLLCVLYDNYIAVFDIQPGIWGHLLLEIGCFILVLSLSYTYSKRITRSDARLINGICLT